MDWTLIGSVLGVIIALIGGIAGVVQIIQYFEERKKRSASKLTSSQVKQKHPSRSLLPLSSVPNNLPPRSTFVGRDEEKRNLYNAITWGPRLIVVEGVAGIGKSSLALEVTYRCLADSFSEFDQKANNENCFRAFIWITAKASDITLGNVLDIIARTLDYPYVSQLEEGHKLSEVNKLLREIKTLLVIDNFETIQDQRVAKFVENIPQPSKVLITTRYRRQWGVEYTPIVLGKMQPEEALQLIKGEGERLRLDSLARIDRMLLINLCEAVGGSPLAIKWAVGQMRQHGSTLASVMKTLEAARGDLFESMFARSWQFCTDASKKVLMTMPIFAATVSRAALQATANVHNFEFNDAIGQLVELWLLESNQEVLDEKQRFSVHPLTRAFVARELSQYPFLENEMRMRAVQHYLEFCEGRRYLQRGAEGYNEIETDVANILRVIEWLSDWCITEQKLDACRLIVAFSDAINVFLWSRGYWGERVWLCQRALEASKSLEDWSSAGRQAYYIGIVRIWQGDIQEAEKWAMESMSMMKRSGKSIDVGLAQRLMGLVSMGKADYEQAIDFHRRVLAEISRPTMSRSREIAVFADWVCPGPQGNKVGIVSLLQELGIINNRRGDHKTAAKWLQKSKTLAQEIGDIEGLSISLSHLGHAFLGLGRLEDAKECYSEGLRLATKVQRKSTMGRCNQGMADVASREGRVEDAIRFGREAIDLFKRLGMRWEKEYVENIVSSNQAKLGVLQERH